MAITLNGTTNVITPASAVQPTGAILQVKQNSNTTSTGYVDMTTSLAYYDITNMNVAITPASTSNKILVSLFAMGEADRDDHHIRWRLKRAISGGATTYIQGGDTPGSRTTTFGMIGVGETASDNTTTPVSFGFSNYLDSPSTTSETTYTFQVGINGGNKKWYYNRTVNDNDTAAHERGISYITVMEVAG